MREFRDFPIRHKLMSISLLASTAALVLASVGFLTFESVVFRETTRDRLESVAGVIAVNSVVALRFDDDEAASEILEGLRGERQIVAACLFRRDGAKLAGYGRSSSGEDCPERGRRSAARRRLDGIVLSVPVSEDGQELGTIWIHAESATLADHLGKYTIMLLLVMAASVGVAWLLSSKLQARIATPLLRLVDTARRISRANDFSLRAPREGNDEVGLLIDSFNAMLAQIQERDHRLERNREHLEESVAERTAGLVSAVEELHAEIEQRKKAEERIRFLAYYDVLTGLPNRQFLRERLAGALEAASEEDPVALLFIDLDRFKEINDSLGHSAGDLLLRHVAGRLLSCVRRTDLISSPRVATDDETSTVSRQGGDEFTILLTRIRKGLDAGLVAKRILEALQCPVTIVDREVVIGASIGIAVYPADGTDADTLLKHADTAMYHAKASGRNEYQYFSESMREAALQKITLENDLRKAIEREEFDLHFQPKLNMRTGRVTGVEALMRWEHPEEGLIVPSAFVAVAEESGLIVPIGSWVLRAACEQCRRWVDQGLNGFRVAVNVSNLQFRKSSLLATVAGILDDTGLDPRCLELEITESAMMHDEDEAIDALNGLRELGIRVALDDFGTGYSSLSYVRRLPLDAIKIDRSFVSDLGVNAESASIVTAIISMAHSLGLEVVAEGVETLDQADFLYAQGCNELQGYLVSSAVPAVEIGGIVSTIADDPVRFKVSARGRAPLLRDPPGA